MSGRFAKGQSGNPSGRPRAAKPPQPSAFDIVIDRTLTVVQNGREREITVDEALQQKTYQEALAGSRMAQRQIMKMIEKREAARAAKHPPRRSFSTAHEHDSGHANEALVILGVARRAGEPSAPRLKLETWAVQAALDRRRRVGFTAKELSDTRLVVVDAAAIRWPQPVPE